MIGLNSDADVSPSLPAGVSARARALWQAFAPLVKGRVSVDEVVRARYARDASDRSRLGFLAGVSPALPEIVAWPQDLAETQALIRQAAEMGLGVVPVGGLTNQFGAAHFERGGLCLDLKRMNRVLEIDAESLEVVCEAGVNGARLSAALARHGLTPGHIPASISHATIGGWIASRASGEASATEGRIEERLLGLTLVDGLGRVRQLDLDPMRREESAALLVGSEGALGVICSARLRLPPRGLQRRFASFAFNGLEHGIDALRALLRSGLRPAMARLCDPLSSAFLTHALLDATPRVKSSLQGHIEGRARDAVNEMIAGRLQGAARVMNLAARALRQSRLVLVFEAEASLVALQVEQASRLLRGLSGRDLGWEHARHWFDNRVSERSLYARLASFGALSLDFDVAADWSLAGRLCRKMKRALSPQALVVVRLSQPRPEGACLNFTLIAPPEPSPEATESRRAALLNQALGICRAEGAVFGHHGAVGLDRLAAFRAELGSGFHLLRHVKASFDPDCRLCPGSLGLEAAANRGADREENFDGAEGASEATGGDNIAAAGDGGEQSVLTDEAAANRPALERLSDVAGRIFRRMGARPEDALERGSESWALVRQVRKGAGVNVRLRGDTLELVPTNAHEAARSLAVVQSMEERAARQGYALRLVLDGFNRIAEPSPLDGSVRVGAAVKVDEVEATLRRAGFTLGGLTPLSRDVSVGEWIEGRWEAMRAGARGELESAVLSFTAILRGGGILESRLSGMRAGPRLEPMIVGGAGRFGSIVEARLSGLPMPEAEERFHLILDSADDLPRLLREALACGLFFTEGAVRQKSDGRIWVRLHLASQPFRKERDRDCLRAILKNHGQVRAMGEVSQFDVAREFEVPLSSLPSLLSHEPALAIHRISARSVVIVGPAEVEIGRDLSARDEVA